MATYLYTSNKHILPAVIDTYCNGRKVIPVDSLVELRMAFNKMMSELIITMDANDTELYNFLMELETKKKYTVITDDLILAGKLSSHVQNIITLDDYLLNMPSIWDTTVTKFDNILKLHRANLRSVLIKSDIQTDNDIFRQSIVEENGLTYVLLESIPEKELLGDLKRTLIEERKHQSKLIKERDTDKQELSSDIAQHLKIANNFTGGLRDYLVYTKLILQEELEPYPIDLTEQDLLQQLVNDSLISLEDLVSLVGSYYSIQMFGKETLNSMVFKRIKVSNELVTRGVIEAYYPHDTDFTSTILIIPYTERANLQRELESSLNYSQIVYTLPQYIKGLM